MRVRLGQLQLT